MAKKSDGLKAWIQAYLQQESPRSKSLIVSAFGDSFAPYAEGIWLGELIGLMAPLGMSERLVRTSVFRLIEEGWLRARREGRRSYYTLTEAGQAKFESAYSHIYEPPETDWDGLWTLVILLRQAEASSDRSEFKRELIWSGFATLTAGLFIHPSITPAEVARLVQRCKLSEQAVVMRAADPEPVADNAGRRNLLEAWNLSDISKRYQDFVDRFAPLAQIVQSQPLSALDAFVVQTLLIHSFRRTNLDDPRIPLSLLDADWPGTRAFDLCRQIYRRTYALTARHLASLPGFETMDHTGSRLKMPIGLRFGGLGTNALAA